MFWSGRFGPISHPFSPHSQPILPPHTHHDRYFPGRYTFDHSSRKLGDGARSDRSWRNTVYFQLDTASPTGYCSIWEIIFSHIAIYFLCLHHPRCMSGPRIFVDDRLAASKITARRLIRFALCDGKVDHLCPNCGSEHDKASGGVYSASFHSNSSAPSLPGTSRARLPSTIFAREWRDLTF